MRAWPRCATTPRRQRKRLDAQGRLYTCEGHARRVTRRDRKGKLEILADQWQGKRLNAPNDLIVRRDGHVYFTDPAFGSAADSRELDFYGIFHITPKGELSLVAKWPTRPNGITLSPMARRSTWPTPIVMPFARSILTAPETLPVSAISSPPFPAFPTASHR